jgi:hypothetical protein
MVVFYYLVIRNVWNYQQEVLAEVNIK